MDTNNNGQAPATDDQELAQVLAGMNQQAGTESGLQFEETGATPDPAAAPDPAAPADGTTDGAQDLAAPDVPTPAEVPPLPELPAADPAPSAPVVETSAPAAPAPMTTASPELESIKKDALEQLRPLVDKLDLDPQEKFDTLLLIIRSTDDQSLVGAANEAAKAITDDTKRAEALLDVIKEIDFFSGTGQAQA